MPSREELEQKRREHLAAAAELAAQLAELPEEEAEAPPPPPPPVDDDDAATRPSSAKTVRRDETDSPAAPRAPSPVPPPPEMAPAAPPPRQNLVVPVAVRPPPPPRPALPPAAVVPQPGACTLKYGSTGLEMRRCIAGFSGLDLDGPDPHGKHPYACWANSPALERLLERMAKAEAASKASVAPFGCCVHCSSKTRNGLSLIAGAQCCSNVWCQKEWCESCREGVMRDDAAVPDSWNCGHCPKDVPGPREVEPWKPNGVPELFAPVEFSGALKAEILSDAPDVKRFARLFVKEFPWFLFPERFDPTDEGHFSSLLERLKTWIHAGRRLGIEQFGATESRVRTFCGQRLEREHPGLVAELKRHDDDCKEAAEAAAGEPPDQCVLCRLRDKVVAEACGRIRASNKRGRPSSEAVATLAAEALSELSVLVPLATDMNDLAAVDGDEEKDAETAPGEGELVPDHLKYWPLVRLIDGEPCWACKFCNTKVSFIFCTFPHDVALQLFTRAITWACTSLATQSSASATAS